MICISFGLIILQNNAVDGWVSTLDSDQYNFAQGACMEGHVFSSWNLFLNVEFSIALTPITKAFSYISILEIKWFVVFSKR